MDDISKLKDQIVKLTTENTELLNLLKKAMSGNFDEVKEGLSKLNLGDPSLLSSGLQALSLGTATDGAKKEAEKAGNDAAAQADKTKEEGKEKAEDATEDAKESVDSAINAATNLAKGWGGW